MAQLERTFDFVDGDYSVEILAPKELMAEMQARCRSGPPEEEMEGLDIGEHGNNAYHGFVMEKS